MDKLISRYDAIQAMLKEQRDDIKAYGCSIPEGFDGDRAVRVLMKLPTVDIDMSDYSDRLWRSAYERGKAVGKAEGVIRCKDCAYRNGFASNVCPMLKAHKVRLRDDDYCSYAERKITHGKK